MGGGGLSIIEQKLWMGANYGLHTGMKGDAKSISILGDMSHYRWIPYL